MGLHRICKIIVAFGVLVPAVARAHDWYPQQCCSGQDCRPVPCDEITASPDYYFWKGMRFPKNAAKPSEDNQCHICASPGGMPRCMFLQGSV